MAIHPNQPDEYFPFLARFLSLSSEWSCDDVLPGRDGVLSATFRRPGEEVEVLWSVVRPAEGGTPFRNGSISVKGGSVSHPLVGQVCNRLAAMFARRTPWLVEPRNREHDSLAFSAKLPLQLWGGLLVPGVTRRGPFVFEDATMIFDRLRLDFRGPSGIVSLGLAPNSHLPPNAIVLVGTGPLALLAPEDGSAPTGIDLLVDYVGYLLALSTHDGMSVADAPKEGQKVPREPRPDEDPSPFLFSELLDEINLFNAFFAAEGRLAVVTHMDRECTHYFPYLHGPLGSFNPSPWGIRPSLEYRRAYRSADTGDVAAIVTGVEEQFSDLVIQAIGGQRPQLLFVIDSCVAKIIGDDVGSALSFLQEDLEGIPVVHMEVTVGPPLNYRRLWERLVRVFQKPPTAGSSRPDSVNLIGYGHSRTVSLPELKALLSESGISVVASLLPSFNLDELPQFGDARLNVLFPAAAVREAFRDAARLCQAPFLDPPPPFGFKGTRDWLDSVRQALGHPLLTDEGFDRLSAPFRPRWDALRRRAEGQRVVIVLREDHFERESDPLQRFGVPWIQFLDEMGFGIDLLMLPAAQEVGEPATPRLAEVLESSSGGALHRLTAVASEAELRGAMRESTASLAYTEMFHDRRVTASGKVPFSAIDFEPGLAGACRTLECLLGHASIPFFRQYRDQLSWEGGDG